MDTLFTIVLHILYGFLGFLLLLFVLATEASAGQVCRVVYGGLERFAEPIRPD
jgi:hypothetical protein